MKKALVPFNQELRLGSKYCLTIDTYKWADNNYQPKVEVFLCHNNEK